MDAAGRFPHHLRSTPTRRHEAGALSPIEALSPAWEGTTGLLFRPFSRRSWIALSIICLFLGGGTSTAAFQWGFGALPIDLHASEVLFRVRLIMAEHASLIVLAAVLSLGILLSFIYVRCVLRFVLIDAVIRRQVAVGEAWKSLESQGRAYFGWLLAVVGVVLVGVCAAVLTTLRYLNVIRDAGYPEWLTSLLLAMELLTVVSVGLLLTITIMLTDDLVAPLVYAERISLPAAWRVFWVMARRDSGSFSVYLLFRLAVGMGISIAVLIVLFPVLMGLSSGALVIAALVILALRAVGLVWIWNPVTMILGAAALSLFTALLFALLSVIGMPGQIYLQNYGVRFMASRVPSLGVLCRDTAAQGRDR